MRIWNPEATIDSINQLCTDTMVDHLGIEITQLGDDFIKATMPVDHRTVQPMRLLHGGASVALAETIGSIASVLVIDQETTSGAVGITINANHIKSVAEKSMVTGIVKPISLGKSIHVWEISIFDSKEDLCCICRLTTKVLKKRS